MSFVAVAIGASGVIGAGASIYNANKNAQALKDSYHPLDIDKIIGTARDTSAANLKNSIALEKQYLPGTAALRPVADTALSNLASGNTAGFQARNSLLAGLTSPIADSSVSNNPLLTESSNRILGQLNLGGKLDAETQNAIARGALQAGGAAGISGSGAGRGLVARDLGLTSLALMQQRQQAAQTAGATMANLNLAGQNLKLQDYLGRYGAASNAAGQDTSATGLLAGLIDNRQMPNSGLSASDVANLYTGGNNANNQAAANSAAAGAAARNSNLNAILGFGSTAIGAYAGYKTNAAANAAANQQIGNNAAANMTLQ